MNLSKVPAEISLGWAYIPPILVDVLIGLVCAYAIASLLNLSRLSRYIAHPPLAFMGLWILATSLVGLFVLPP